MGQVLTLGVDMMNLLLSFCAALLLRVGSKGHKGLSLLPVKQVTTLPWHFTPKGALFGPIYGIYVG